MKYGKGMQAVNRNMKKLRLKSGITQKTMGEYLGLDHRTISSYENGLFEPSATVILKYCDYFNVRPDELLGYIPPEKEDEIIIPNAEELEMLKGFRRRRDYQQNAIRMLCLNGTVYLTEEEEIKEEKQWLEYRNRLLQEKKGNDLDE